MLTHPTFEQLNQLGLFGMAKAFGETEASAEAAALTHPEWLALLLGRELAYTTVMTTLARLHSKGLVDRVKSGRAFAYSPVKRADEQAAEAMSEVAGAAAP